MGVTLTKKVCLLGDCRVGKTSLAKRFVFDVFDDRYIVTIGTKTSKKELSLVHDGEAFYLTFIIWDILGEKEYRLLHEKSIKGATGAFVVVDITRKETFESLTDYWIQRIEEILGNVPVIILGNKVDMNEQQEVTDKEFRSLSSRKKMPYYYTSAKTGEKVEEAFYRLGQMIIEDLIKRTPKKSSALVQMFTPMQAMDRILIHFTENFAKEFEIPMAIFANECRRLNINILRPTKDDIGRLILRLYELDKLYLPLEIADKNKEERFTVFSLIK